MRSFIFIFVVVVYVVVYVVAALIIFNLFYFVLLCECVFVDSVGCFFICPNFVLLFDVLNS